MEFEKLYEPNKQALDDYCEILLMLRDVLGRKERAKKNTNVLCYLIRSVIRDATDQVTRYSGSGKDAAQWISEDAKAFLESTGKIDKAKCFDNKHFVFEHVIPIRVLVSNILQRWTHWTKKELRKFLLDYSVTAVISNSENNRLNPKFNTTLGSDLRNDMPRTGSDGNTAALGTDTNWRARYDAPGVNIKLFPRDKEISTPRQKNPRASCVKEIAGTK
jgi:hypothetical protein